MSFADTYELEVLHSRKIRAQRAFFWARVISILLMLTIALALRADPQLRSVLLRAGMDGIAKIARMKDSGKPHPIYPNVTAPQDSSLPRARIKINRPGGGPGSLGASRQQVPDVNALAAEVARKLADQRVDF